MVSFFTLKGIYFPLEPTSEKPCTYCNDLCCLGDPEIFIKACLYPHAKEELSREWRERLC